MFDNLVKYTDIRRTQNYAEYAKKAGARAVSEAEYNRVRALNRALNKVSVGQALKDKTTRKAMMAHSVIFVRSLPVVGQGYALGMAVKNMVSKSYWQGVKAKAQGTGHAVKTLWSKKGRDKEAWKELYSNAGGLVAEAAGAWMLAGFFVMGISAWHLLRKNETDFFKRSFRFGAHFALVMPDPGRQLIRRRAKRPGRRRITRKRLPMCKRRRRLRKVRLCGHVSRGLWVMAVRRCRQMRPLRTVRC